MFAFLKHHSLLEEFVLIMNYWSYCKSWRSQTQKTKLAYWNDSWAESNHMLIGQLHRTNLKHRRPKQTHHVRGKFWPCCLFSSSGDWGERGDILTVRSGWSWSLCCVLWQDIFVSEILSPSTLVRVLMGIGKLLRHFKLGIFYGGVGEWGRGQLRWISILLIASHHLIKQGLT